MNRIDDKEYNYKKESNLLLDRLAGIGFGKNLVLQNTFYSKDGKSTSRIDLAFTTIPTPDKVKVSVINKIIADHALILINISLKHSRKNNNNEKTIKNYKLINYDALKKDLAMIPWEELAIMSDIDEMTTFFTSNVTKMIQAHTPIHKINLSKTKNNTFLPKSAKKLIKRRDRRKTKLKRSKDKERDKFEIRRLTISIKKKIIKFTTNQNKKAAKRTNNNAGFWKLYIKPIKKGAAKKSSLLIKIINL